MYFITICAKDRAEIFSRVVVGAVVNRPPETGNRPSKPTGHPPEIELTDIGRVVEKEIHVLQEIRKNVFVDRYVIMPNHIHIILIITEGGRLQEGGRLAIAPTVSEIIRLWKRAISKQIGFSPWQKSFHDHIIRNRGEYNRIAKYIDNNPKKWDGDCFFVGAVVNRPPEPNNRPPKTANRQPETYNRPQASNNPAPETARINPATARILRKQRQKVMTTDKGIDFEN
jgi:REP element-mobilizing transposase RayT